MKKMILILILVIPVMIAICITLLAGFVAREVAFVKIDKVEIPVSREAEMERELEKFGMIMFYESENHSVWRINEVIIGKDFPLKNYLKITPEKAKLRDLDCDYSYEIGKDENGFAIMGDTKSESPVIIDNYGYLRGIKETNKETTILIKVDGTLQITFIIKKVVRQ